MSKWKRPAARIAEQVADERTAEVVAEADKQELHRRRSSDYSNLREAFHANPALTLLALFNVVIICLAVFGIVTTNHRAQEEIADAKRKAAEGTQVVSCLFATQQELIAAHNHHIVDAAKDHGYAVQEPPTPVLTNQTVDEACEGIAELLNKVLAEKEKTNGS